MPGSEKAQVERSMQLADRISINLEAPNALRLKTLAPGKQFIEELIQPLKWAEEIRQEVSPYKGWNNRWPSTVTQFVVGAAGDTDLELLATTESLHRNYRLGRAYFSAFTPVSDTPLENTPAESPVREHRLYQSSFLLRDYGFSLEEHTLRTREVLCPSTAIQNWPGRTSIWPKRLLRSTRLVRPSFYGYQASVPKVRMQY
jgi:predicted DNA-binding helix-hairpin-helix protein